MLRLIHAAAMPTQLLRLTLSDVIASPDMFGREHDSGQDHRGSRIAITH
jgi:hypothetical protein